MEEIKTEQTTINNTQTENNINQETLVEGKKPPFKKRKVMKLIITLIYFYDWFNQVFWFVFH